MKRTTGAMVAMVGLGAACSTAAPAALVAGLYATDGRATDTSPVDAGDALVEVSCSAGTVTDPGVCSGSLDPTVVAVGVEPVAAGITPGAPGRHWFCRPGDGVAWNGRVLLHLVGTYSNPADDNRFAAHACALGFAAIVPMYENRDAIRQTCGDDAGCYEAFHAEITYGRPEAPSPVEVDVPNSILARARSLSTRLVTGDPGFRGWSSVAGALAGDDWSTVALSGHSQGSGHALYLARDFAAERLVILAGPADRLRDGRPDHATVPWITALGGPTPPRTARGRMYVFIHRDDGIENFAQVESNWGAIGLSPVSCAFASAAGYPTGCRRVFIDADGCSAYNAHATVVVRRWGARCALGAASTYTSQSTWRYLLTNE